MKVKTKYNKPAGDLTSWPFSLYLCSGFVSSAAQEHFKGRLAVVLLSASIVYSPMTTNLIAFPVAILPIRMV